MLKKIFFVLYVLFAAGQLRSIAQQNPVNTFLNDAWANTLMNTMPVDEKIGQLVMITAYPDKGVAYKNQLIKLIEEYQPGGVLIMQGSPVNTATLINKLQEAAHVPLLIAIDGETGLGFRLDSTISYPGAQALGAVNNPQLLYRMGADIAKQFKQVGINVNFAPVADVNTNPENPVINFRSFGENKHNVAEKAIALVQGMQDEGILSVAKHFPGHGDTKTDSHLSLPTLNKTRQQIESTEIYPFKMLIDKEVGGIMTAHLHVAPFDHEALPASLSENVIKKYLVDTLNFNGLIFTDAMNMGGVNFPKGVAELKALKAGNDIVEFVPDIEKTISAIKNGLSKGEISIEEIDKKCRKILAAKRWLGLHLLEPVETKNLAKELNNPLYEVNLRRLIESSLTVVKNNHVLPISGLDTLKVASVKIGGGRGSRFQQMLANYTKVEHFHIAANATHADIEKLMGRLKKYNLIIGGIHGVNMYPANNYGISNIQVEAVKRIVNEKQSVFVFFGNAYALKYFTDIEKAAGLVLSYSDSKLVQELSAQLLFGAIDATGRLPVTINIFFKEGQGIPLEKNGRFKYTIPEELKIRSGLLEKKIDSVAILGLDSAAYPGCQVLIALDGNIIFHKCYGYQTYDSIHPVTKGLVYDWASITKITGPLPGLMKLNAQGLFGLDEKISKYWLRFIGSDKENIINRDILAHQSRMQAWIPYWKSAVRRNGKLKTSVFRKKQGKKFSVRISSSLYMNNKYRETIFRQITESPLLDTTEYVYSGLAFYLFPDIIAQLTGGGYETYLKETFYKPLGAYTITFNPYKYYPLECIVPTEMDNFFRDEQIHGFVHDEGAAMMGGVSGNAGLFGTANDLAKIMQMYLSKGVYGGERFIPEKIVNEFTRCQFPDNGNRRGLGFDKPLQGNSGFKLPEAYPAVDASEDSFGHSGYTGTFTWADPANNLLFIFLSNRVYPSRENSKLYNLNIRPAMHQAIYDCIKAGL